MYSYIFRYEKVSHYPEVEVQLKIKIKDFLQFLKLFIYAFFSVNLYVYTAHVYQLPEATDTMAFLVVVSCEWGDEEMDKRKVSKYLDGKI